MNYIQSTLELLQLGFVQRAIIALTILSIASGLLGPIILIKKASFAVHGCSELSLTGAAAALFFSFSVPIGAIVGAVLGGIIFMLLQQARKTKESLDTFIGVVLGFGLGLAILFLHLYPGSSTTALALITGQIVAIDVTGLIWLATICSLASIILIIFRKKMIFSTLEPELAKTQGISSQYLNYLFILILGLLAAQAVQVVGSLLVISLLVTPAAAAKLIAKNLKSWLNLSVLFAVLSSFCGVIISLPLELPVSVPVTVGSFLIYIICYWKTRE